MVKARLSTRMLRAHASAGELKAFEAELQKWGSAPLEDPAGLLQHALAAESEAGAAAVATLILMRPEGSAAISAPDSARRTPLHAMVAANRWGLCQFLVERRADL